MDRWHLKQFNKIFDAHKNSASIAQSLNVGVNAGHDLNLTNVKKYVAQTYINIKSIQYCYINVSAINY